MNLPLNLPSSRLPALRPREGKVRSKMIVGLVLVLALSGAGIASLTGHLDFGRKKVVSYLTKPVRRGPLDILLVERGSVDSANNVTLNSEVEGTTTIIKIVDEGKSVKPGEVLVELDSSKFKDLQIQQQIQVEQAQAAHLQARENKEIQKTQNDSDFATATLNLEVAQGELEQLKEGDRIKQEFQLKGTIALAQEEVTRAKEKYDFVKRNNKKGYYNQNDVETARIALEKAEFNLGLAEEDLKLYQSYTFRLLIKQKAASVDEFKRAVERAKLKANAALAQAEATLKAAELTERVEKEKLVKYENQIKACTISAPHAGEVVYANASNDRRGSNEATIMEGASVRERQAIVNLPDYSQMQVSTKIHESRIGLVHSGLPVIVRIEAVPGVIFHGQVENVSSVPISGNWRTPDLKEYTTIVRITDDEKKVRELKPGMTAEVEIQVEKIASALVAPVQTVVEWGGKNYVFRLREGQIPEQVEVQIGRTNDILIEFREAGSSVREGDELVMNPRQLLPAEPPPEKERVEQDKDQKSPEKGKTPSPVSSEVAKGDAARPNADKGTNVAVLGGTEGNPRSRSEGGVGGQPGGGGGGGRRDPAAFFARMDANQNGRLEGDEINERFRGDIAAIDLNKDGAIDLEELKQRFAAMAGSRPSGPDSNPGGPRSAGDRPASPERRGGNRSPANGAG